MAQPGESITHARQQGWRTVAILHVRRMHDHPNRQSDGVGKDVPFAALDHFLGRISARATRRGRLDRLAVDDASARARLPASGLPHVHQQHVVDGLPYPVVAPRVEIPLHRCVWREILGQQTPLAAGLGDIEDAIDDIPQAGLARPPAARRRWWGSITRHSSSATCAA